MNTDKDRVDFIERMLVRMGPGQGAGVDIGRNSLLECQPGIKDKPVQIFTIPSQHMYGKTARDVLDIAMDCEKLNYWGLDK